MCVFTKYQYRIIITVTSPILLSIGKKIGSIKHRYLLLIKDVQTEQTDSKSWLDLVTSSGDISVCSQKSVFLTVL